MRRAWNEFANRGYGLSNLAKHFNFSFNHHDAVEDAIVTGKIIIKACERTKLTIDDWFARVFQPIDSSSRDFKLEGNPEGIFYGESVVFTGGLGLTRSEAARLASELGCKVLNSVTKKTTLLVVGTQDISRLSGYSKSSKHRKAEALIENGIDIKIISEADFQQMLKLGN